MQMCFWHSYLLLLNISDTTHETSNPKPCYVLSHISHMVDNVIVDQFSTLMLCMLIAFTMGEFFEVA
jgi:hypothetical protein